MQARSVHSAASLKQQHRIYSVPQGGGGGVSIPAVLVLLSGTAGRRRSVVSWCPLGWRDGLASPLEPARSKELTWAELSAARVTALPCSLRACAHCIGVNPHSSWQDTHQMSPKTPDTCPVAAATAVQHCCRVVRSFKLLPNYDLSVTNCLSASGSTSLSG